MGPATWNLGFMYTKQTTVASDGFIALRRGPEETYLAPVDVDTIWRKIRDVEARYRSNWYPGTFLHGPVWTVFWKLATTSAPVEVEWSVKLWKVLHQLFNRYCFRPIHPANIADGDERFILFRKRRRVAIRPEDLGFLARLQWNLRTWTQPDTPQHFPQATWAQMLQIFGLRSPDHPDLVGKFLSKSLMDADTIPSTLDAPLQRIRLRDLGLFALIMGFDDVSISPHELKFTAMGPLGSITAVSDPTLGHVLRLEGDLLQIRHQLLPFTPLAIRNCLNIADGELRSPRRPFDPHGGPKWKKTLKREPGGFPVYQRKGGKLKANAKVGQSFIWRLPILQN
jgi:hypothetical protein